MLLHHVCMCTHTHTPSCRQSPLDALGVAIKHAVAAGAPHAAMILGLPFYGKVYICNGTTTPVWG